MIVSGWGRPAVFAVSMVLAACAPWQTSEPVTPASYKTSRAQIPRTVGKLRRMVVLQVEQASPKECGYGTDGERTLTLPDEKGFVSEYLVRKGYEVVAFDEARFVEGSAASDRAGFVDELVLGLREPGEAAAGPRLLALLERLRQDDRIDGVLVFGEERSCLNANAAARSAYGIGTLGLHWIWPDKSWQQVYFIYRVQVFETTSGRVVWRNEWNALTQATDFLKSLGSTAGPRAPFDSLFEPLEEAVPKVLTR